jgi:hypothetical protein
MTSKLGRFASKYHGLGDGHRTIAGIPVEIAALQKILLTSIPGDTLLDFAYVNKDGAPSVDLTVKLDMLVVLAVFTFLGAVLLGAF